MKRVAHSIPLRVASVGLGNWAGRVVDFILNHQSRPNPSVRLVSVYEPQLSQHMARASKARAAGAILCESYESLLRDAEVDAVILPVPIHLHRPMTEQALAAGKPVLVEKPVAGVIQDVDAMIAARNGADLPVLVSFQDTYDPAVRRLKRLILDGTIGTIASASLLGCWPRDDAYFRRCAWAGRIQFQGKWVLDSPVSNAFAHYLHLMFYLLGTTENQWAVPEHVEAELYRANAIENYDTASQRFAVGGVPVLALLTHACLTSVGPSIEIRGSKGTIRIDLENRTARITSDSTIENVQLAPDSRECVLADLARFLRGEPTGGSVSTLEASRSHVLAGNGASQGALVRSIPETHILNGRSGDGEPCRVIPGIEQALLFAFARGQMLHESGLVEWSNPAGRLDLRSYSAFTGCPALSTFIEPRPRACPADPHVELIQ